MPQPPINGQIGRSAQGIREGWLKLNIGHVFALEEAAKTHELMEDRKTATLSKVFPKIKCDYPRDASGKLIPQKLDDEELKNYEGVLGHFHIQTNKVDPGPAFQWDYVINGARQLLRSPNAETPKGSTGLLPARWQRGF